MAIEVGTKVTGKVSGITNFGAFVNLGNNQTGLVHISEVSDGFVKDIHDVLSVGDDVTVKVLSVGNDGKIGLSIRKAVDHPQGEHQQHDNHHSSNNHQGGNHQGNNHGHFDRNEHQGNGNHQRTNNFHSRGGNGGGRFQSRQHENKKQDFDSLMSGFLKESEDRLTTLKRNTEGKRGGRGGRRS